MGSFGGTIELEELDGRLYNIVTQTEDLRKDYQSLFRKMFGMIPDPINDQDPKADKNVADKNLADEYIADKNLPYTNFVDRNSCRQKILPTKVPAEKIPPTNVIFPPNFRLFADPNFLSGPELTEKISEILNRMNRKCSLIHF